MKATHNVKINGRWYSAGEELPEQKPVKVVKNKPEEKKVPESEPVNEEQKPAETETVKEEPKPKSTARRKISK